jgi:3-methyladenine DNA glycosylase AlkD
VTERISCAAILTSLKSLARPENIAGMARYGINPHRTYGVSMPVLRQLAREIGKDHRLAAGLWSSGIHEARILATLVDDPALVTEDQMDRWVGDLDSWDVCDQCCNNLFSRTLLAYRKAVEWAGFVLAEQIRQIDSASARWIAADALRELTDPAVQKRLKGQS